METLDAGARQSVGLPSINHLDSSEKVKREEGPGDYQRKHSTAAMVSPSYSFPGPTHSFSNHQSSSANAVAGTLGGLLSPPESCLTSGDEKDAKSRPPARQSLPSIHEALGGSEQPLSYPAPPSSAPISAPQPYHPSSTANSPSDQRSRTYSTEIQPPGPPNPYSHPRSPYMNAPPPPTTAATAPPQQPLPQTQTEPLPRPTFPPTQHNSKLPQLHPLRTTQSPPTSSARPGQPYSSYPPQPQSAFAESAPHSAGSMNPYGYSQYPGQYPLSAPPPGAPGPVYPASAATYSAPPRFPPPSWRSENSDLNRTEESKKPYGENVKRHLESFDLEASLNEMAEGAGRITDFSKIYRQKAHDNTRIGMTPNSMPRLEEVDEMMKQSEKIQVSLQRMREVVFNHQQVNIVEQKQDPRYRPINGFEHEGSNNYHEDSKGAGGFAGPDPKKRRGRAAPPGRCHSCNRAETPEWRRGPDGARTLCNACGLHYAKLTRKMGGNKTMGSSNIRPKSLGGEGSSTA